MSAIREQAKRCDIFSTENMFMYVDATALTRTNCSFVVCYLLCYRNRCWYDTRSIRLGHVRNGLQNDCWTVSFVTSSAVLLSCMEDGISSLHYCICQSMSLCIRARYRHSNYRWLKRNWICCINWCHCVEYISVIYVRSYILILLLNRSKVYSNAINKTTS